MKETTRLIYAIYALKKKKYCVVMLLLALSVGIYSL